MSYDNERVYGFGYSPDVSILLTSINQATVDHIPEVKVWAFVAFAKGVIRQILAGMRYVNSSAPGPCASYESYVSVGHTLSRQKYAVTYIGVQTFNNHTNHFERSRGVLVNFKKI